MGRITFLAIVFMCCALFAEVSGQQSAKNYPVQFSQFIFGYSMVNPSSLGADNNYEITAAYRKPVSGFTGVSTYFFSLGLVPYRMGSTARNKSMVGLRFFNDIEGAYINRSRFYLVYAFHTNLSANLRFSGGMDIGGMNFSVKATPTTEGASILKPDANVGVWFYNADFHAGFSVNQLFRSVFQPLDEQTVLPTYVNFTASYAILQRENFRLRPHLLLSFPYYSSVSLQASLYGLFYDKFMLVAGWNRKKDISAMVGLKNLQISESYLDFVLSYSTSVQKAALSISRMELSLIYSL